MSGPHRERGVTPSASAEEPLAPEPAAAAPPAPEPPATSPPRRARSRRTLLAAAVVATTAVALAAGAAAADVLPGEAPAPAEPAGTGGVASADQAAQAVEPAAEGGQNETGALFAAGELPATADTFVVTERPGQSFGGDTEVTASGWQDWHSEAYLRFEVPAETGEISGAELVLTLNREDRRPPEAQLREVLGDWDESTTYDQRPELGDVVATATVSDGDELVFDVTDLVDGPGGYDFGLTNPAGQTVVSAHSREQGGQGPRLVVTAAGGEAPPPPPPPPAPAAASGTLCGASWVAESRNETYQQALARLDGYYGDLESVRVFYTGLPADWPGKLDADGRPMVVSFKADPAEVAAGRHDQRLRRWFEDAPRDQDIYWSFYHEPENNILDGEFTPDEYRRAWRHLSELAAEADNPRLYATLILMGWSVNPESGRDYTDYFPGTEYLDVLAWDLYNPGWENNAYRPVREVFRDVIETSEEIGLPWGVAETGSGLIRGDDGEGRAEWLRDLTTHLSAEGALFVQLFDLDWTDRGAADYRLRDPHGQAAWREFCDS